MRELLALLPDQVAAKINPDGPIPEDHVYLGPCWMWTGAVGAGGQGYGLLTLEQEHHRAHRFVYSILVAPVADTLELDHLCEQTLCVRPSHLQPVTHQENIRRHYARQATCKHGHEWTPENTYIRPSTGRRECRACSYDRHLARSGA